MTTFKIDTNGAIARWAFEQAGSVPLPLNGCVGVFDGEVLKGAFAFTGYNGSEIEVHYYGPGALKRQVVREIFNIALSHFRVNRLVVRTRKVSMSRGVKKLGAIFEGVQRRVYGPTDGLEHAAQVWVFFRERMLTITGIKELCHVRQQ